jgi:lipopolysaccharide biosynthesis glycosyltransferase
MLKEKIQVVFAPDENYAVLAGVAMTSILHHASEPGRFHFYFLQGDRKLSAGSRAKFHEVIEAYGAALDYVEVDVRPLAGFENHGPKHISSAVYYCLMIPELLPDLARCLYLDCDVLALGDLAELWDTNNAEAAVAAVCDCYVDRAGLKKYKVIKHYFNSGVMLMNLQRWRERGHTQRCLQLLADPQMRLRFANQDVLNVVFCDDVHFLHPRWNIQTGQKHLARTKELDQEWQEILQAPRLAHFTTRSKPGVMGMTHPWSMEYWRMLARTPWGRETAALREKMLLAKLHRLKRVIQKFLRWTLEASLNREKGTCRLVLCGRILVDRKPRNPTDELQS